MYKAIVVDDEKMIRIGIQKVIPWESIGVGEVYVAASGQEAFKIIEENKPDIMITDISMNGMSGLELINKVNRINRKIKIIVLTGHSSFDYAQKCLRMQVEDFFLKPIDEDILTKAIKKLVDHFETEKKNLISQKMIQRTQGTKEQLKLEKVMRDLVHNRTDNQKEIYGLIEEYNYNLEMTMQVAIIIPTLHVNSERNEEKFIELSIKNICIDLFDSQGQGITFIDDDNKIVIALFENNTLNEVERINQLNNILKDEYDITPKVVLGSSVTGFSELVISYNDAMYLLETETENIREIIQSYNSESKIHLFNNIFVELKNIMVSNVGNSESVIKAFNTFGTATKSYNLADNYVCRCCFDIASTMYFAYIHNSGESTDSKLTALLVSLLHATRADACEFTREFIIQLFSKEEDHIHEIVSKAKSLIDEYLADDLSISTIATKLFITPNYFSRLFKKVTGEGCNAYIVRKRIEKAKCLLETTNLKTGKIAIIVGYRDTNYFSLAFKKHEGTSPTKYREFSRT